ncbi:RES family NAD+ phosphorylase [Sphingomonas sp. DBB INV C78]|uniref:RES family NAD+ phosphorylase n=1 Tax=Sphingomonas sp. DBB INV C78 TaxID=3349434 RepID=UPI0036D35A35
MAGVRLRRIDAGVRLHRIHRTAHDPIFFGPAGAPPEFRYDSPDGSYKVLYAARSLETAFGETLVRLPAVSYVLSSAVEARVRSELETTRALKLYPLVDAGVSAHGLSFTDLHGDAYKKTWAVSAEVYATTIADGILYTSRFDNQRCVALFDRASDAIAETAIRKIPITPAQATQLAEHFGKQYIEP